jgi:hypothetical protein
MMKNIRLINLLSKALREAEEQKPDSGKEKTPESDQEAAAKLKRAFQDPNVSGFVQKFKAIAQDPKVQAVLAAGKGDKKGPEDEQLPYERVMIPVLNLKPTQNEIGFDQSVMGLLTDEYKSLKSILVGTNPDVGGEIVIYNSMYVIDGHHRWSSVFAGNPKAKMAAFNIKGKLKPTEVLKAVHAAIAMIAKKVPAAEPKGINILKGISYQEVLEKVNKNLSPEAKDVWAENGQKSNEEIAKYINTNLQKLISANKPVPGAPGRIDMPQTDAKGTGVIKNKLDLLSKGVVNFNEPAANDKEIKETLQRRAGIKLPTQNPEVQSWLSTPIGQKYVQLVQTLMAAEENMTAFIDSHAAGTPMSPKERAQYMAIQKASDNANKNEIAFRRKYVVPQAEKLLMSWTDFMDAAKQA